MRSKTAVTGTVRLGPGTQGRTAGIATYLDAEGAERATVEAIEWIKSLRHLRVDGSTLRDRFTHRGDSLWWFIELYLARERIVVATFKTLAALESLIERESPRALTLVDGNAITRALASIVSERHGVRCAGAGGPPAALRAWTTTSLRHVGETVAARLRPGARAPADECDLVVFVHSAFWRPETGSGGGGDTHLGPVIRALQDRLPAGRVRLVGIGPRRRRWSSGNRQRQAPLPFRQVEHYASLRDVAPSLRLWWQRAAMRRAVRDSADVRAAMIVRGCDLRPLLGENLCDAVGLHLPWAARAMDEVGAALDALRPRAALTYAEAGAWGRTLVMEGRRRGIPVIGMQHGFIDRHVLGYIHATDEMQPSRTNAGDVGYPLPDATLLFDAFAAAHLRTAGHFPPSSLRVVGSPKLDDLAGRVANPSREDLHPARTRTGAAGGQDIVLIASKFSEIRPLFGALVDAIRLTPSVHAVVKCHPEEAPDPYREAANGVPNLTVLPAETDMAPLLRLSRLVVTVNSTVAFDAMTFGVPALAIGLPTNLSPLVDAGAMAGVPMNAPIGPALREVLYDETRRRTLADGARAFLQAHAIRADGHAVQRSVDAIMEHVNP
ncbi:MAG: hypothetical protein F4137_14655 [Acidobacteria bacterium]|nr:hypothetical protein [Acidobacteriota bacterium]